MSGTTFTIHVMADANRFSAGSEISAPQGASNHNVRMSDYVLRESIGQVGAPTIL